MGDFIAGGSFTKAFSSPSLYPEVVKSNPSVNVVFSDTLEKGVDFQNALNGLSNIPISPQFKCQVEEDLRLPVHRTLYKLNYPTILVYTWPNGETRHFVFTNEGTLLEKNDFWLKYFPFIKGDDKTFRIHGNISENGVIYSPESFVWCPDMANFTHFLIDSLSPYIDFCKKFEFIKKLPIPQFSIMPDWQDEYFAGLSERKLFKSSIGSFLVFKPKELYFPFISGTLERILAIQSNLRGLSSLSNTQANCVRCPIFLIRRDARRSRIRNESEIADLVMKMGGFCIDPSKLGIRKTLELFSLNAVFLCEGSGNTNVSVFGNQKARVICLLDSAATSDPAFLHGGWPYFHAASARTDFVCGSDSVQLPGSPLNSCIYSSELIEDKITKQL